VTKKALLITGMDSKLGTNIFTPSFLKKNECYRLTKDLKLKNINGKIINEELLSSISEIVVVHMASPNAQICEDNPSLAFDVNINFIKYIFSKTYSTKIKTFIFFSTSRIYGDEVSSNFHENSSPNMENVYSAIKYLTEKELKKIWLNEECKFDVYILRLSNIIQVLENEIFERPLVNDFCWQAVNENIVTIKNKKNLIKNFLDIRDLVKVLDSILTLPSTNEFNILNIAGPNCYSLYDMALLIQQLCLKLFNSTIDIDIKFKKENQMRVKGKIDIRRANSILGFFPKEINEIISNQLKQYFNNLNN